MTRLWMLIDRDAFADDLAADFSDIAETESVPGSGVTVAQMLEEQDDEALFWQLEEFLKGFASDDADKVQAAQVLATLTLQEADQRGLLRPFKSN